MTNFECIKNMDIDEMVEFLFIGQTCKTCAYADNLSCVNIKCENGVREWLEEELEADND